MYLPNITAFFPPFPIPKKLSTYKKAAASHDESCFAVACLSGAADEARTRYLHLGKVALYQMSYGRSKWSGNIHSKYGDVAKW